MDNVQDLRKWASALQEIHLPRWHELPDISLYMDQVLVFLNSRLELLFRSADNSITQAMVNNYVKQGIVAKPEKKKYGRTQIAQLIVVSVFKTISNLADIGNGIAMLRKSLDSEELYDLFCDNLEQALRRVTGDILAAPTDAPAAAPGRQMLTLATNAAASWIGATGLLLEQTDKK